jgi:hypothetical protein
MLRKFWSDVRQPKITLLGSEPLCRFRRSARMTLPKRARRQDGRKRVCKIDGVKFFAAT